MRRRAVLAGLAGWIAAPAAGQPELPRMPVVVLDRDALFARSAFGQALRAELDAASEALVTENRRIEAELESEELALTERRATTDAEAFRALARAFNAKVEEIRAAQDAKADAIREQRARASQVFQDRAGPVLSRLAGEIGALVILDRRSVIASVEQVDITQLALERLDAELPASVAPAPDPGR